MKKVAIFADGWRKMINDAWIRGCKEYIEEQGIDVVIHAFYSMGNFSLDEKYNYGEYNIFELPDLSEYDGILVEISNITDTQIRRRIIDHVIASGVPAVSLLDDIPELYYSHVDNYRAMTEVVEHLITAHHCRVIKYVSGSTVSWEAKERLRAYHDVLDRYHLPYDRSYVFERDFTIETGSDAFLELTADGRLPDAIVCSNDNQAIGVCQAAQSLGYQVPRDFLVTGYDDFDKAAYFEPRITTVRVTRERIAYKALQLLHEIWNGEQPARDIVADIDFIQRESCGCHSRECMSRGAYVNQSIKDYEAGVVLINELMELKRSMVNVSNMAEIAACMPANRQMFTFEEFYLMMNPEIVEPSPVYFNGEEVHRTIGYPEELDVIMAYRGEELLPQCLRRTTNLIPLDVGVKSGDFYLFSPLHFRDQEAGYIVFKNCQSLMQSQMLFDVLEVFLETCENMYHQMKLARVNETLRQLSVRDSFSGLYNRTAYTLMAEPMFEREIRKGNPVAILFIDLDRLKYINDEFGHDMGNTAIQVVAHAITACCSENGIAMRYGGDEFVLLEPGCDEQQAAALAQNISRQIEVGAAKRKTEFPITASIGYQVAADENACLSDCINHADEKMYMEKKRRKLERRD